MTSEEEGARCLGTLVRISLLCVGGVERGLLQDAWLGGLEGGCSELLHCGKCGGACFQISEEEGSGLRPLTA